MGLIPVFSFFQNIANIKAIRSMSIEKVFSSKFEAAVQETYLGGRKAAPFSSLGYALGSSLTYVSEGEPCFNLPDFVKRH